VCAYGNLPCLRILHPRRRREYRARENGEVRPSTRRGTGGSSNITVSSIAHPPMVAPLDPATAPALPDGAKRSSAERSWALRWRADRRLGGGLASPGPAIPSPCPSGDDVVRFLQAGIRLLAGGVAETDLWSGSIVTMKPNALVIEPFSPCGTSSHVSSRSCNGGSFRYSGRYVPVVSMKSTPSRRAGHKRGLTVKSCCCSERRLALRRPTSGPGRRCRCGRRPHRRFNDATGRRPSRPAKRRPTD